MKRLLAISAVAVLFTAPVATAQMKGMDMKDMDMKGMKSDKKGAGQVHKGTGVVTKVDKDKVTIKHEPIQSLNWPTMTMAFGVKDKAMLDKVAKDKKVEFEFVQQGQQFVITSIK
jgi:Cu(I)/Ag(I) efflux system protein CusF